MSLPFKYWTFWTVYGGKDHAEEIDFSEAIAWFRRAADRGEPGAQYSLGIMHADGDGVVQDSIEAYKWLSLAAAAPYPPPGADASYQRDLVASRMTADQIAEAQRMVMEWKPQSAGKDLSF